MTDDDTDAKTTKAASGDDDTAAAPTEHVTELIETSAAPTPELAWSADTEDQETETTSEKRSRTLWLVPITALLVAAIAVASVLLLYTHRAPATSTGAPAAPPLDGTYRVDVDRTEQTVMGAPNPPNPPSRPGADTFWWAYRSSCTATGCVATGTALDVHDHQKATTPPTTALLHFVDGQWRRAPNQFQRRYDRCLSAEGKSVVPGEDTEQIEWSVETQPDGTFRGVHTNTVLTDECGVAGVVRQSPIVLTRVGDVPPSVIVADPTTVTPAPTSTPTLTVAGPVLDGTYRKDYDDTKWTVNGAPTIGGRLDTQWQAFRSLCTPSGCVATGAALANENQQEPTGGGAEVLRFADGHWQDKPYLLQPTPCSGTNETGTGGDTATMGWSWDPEPDGTFRGVQTITVLTNECGRQGTVYRVPFVATRTGNIPPTVVLADPALFH